MHFRLVLLPVVISVGCGGTPSETVADDGQDVAPLLAGRVVPEAEVARDLRAAGFTENEVPQMVCAAKYESSFYTEASHKNHNGSTDYGLFQINDDLWAGTCGLSVTALYDPAKNAKCARKVYDSGGIRSWYGYQRHHTECDSYTVHE
jgi:lysozyme C